MTEKQALISLSESAEIAGVSLDTIEQYRDYGLLESVTNNGVLQFKESDIRALFYTKQRLATGERNEAPVEQVAADQPTLASILADEPEKPSPEQAPEPEDALEEDGFEMNASAWSESLLDEAADTARFNQQVPAIREGELHEANKSLKDQVEMLKEERNWLRDRIEKLETRSEREQMLLLSENETVRRLIEPRQRRQSFWRRALPFFGAE